MDWTAGYASDVEYVSGFYREQTPAVLNFACALNGYEPVPLDRPYTYFELGFGRGLTANVLAASNPAGQFYATDFNPAHVASASALASSAKLNNLVLLESSFADLAQGHVPDLPQFDFITMHGIYTWVTAENRKHIVEFINRYLKPGGIVYLSYNAMPGWAEVLPLQRLLVEYGDAFPNRSDVQLDGGAKLVEQMTGQNAAAFKGGEILKQRLATLKAGSRNYLVHEYMHKHWQPLYHADVARDLAGAKLDFVGSVDLPTAYRGFYLTEKHQEIIASLPDPVMRETLGDYFLNTSFRKDVFVRGARKMGTARRAAWMAHVGAALLVPRDTVKMKIQFPTGEVNALPAIFNPICDALATRPHLLGELARLPGIQPQNFENIIQAITLLTLSDQVTVFDNSSPARDVKPAQRMNLALAELTRYDDEYQVLCSPLLGSGIGANYIDRLVYLLVARLPASTKQYDVLAMAQQGWTIMTGQGRTMVKDGIKLTDAQQNITELELTIKNILEIKLPLWRQMKAI